MLLVYDHATRDALAVKAVQELLFDRNPEAVELFRREALVWVNLDRHENVVAAEWVHIASGKPLLFLELIVGGDLHKWIVPRLTWFATVGCGGGHLLSSLCYDHPRW